MAENVADNVLVMENITKVYPNGFVANKNVNFSVRKGEIHALVGENGAGKSTLMKVLFGIETPDSGRILLNGKEVQIHNPSSAIKYGIGMVHQHFMLAPSLTVAENMVMGIEPKNMFLFDFAKAVQMTEDVAKKYNFDIDPKAHVKDLPVGQKQKVEILKALMRGAQILILDEPTAVLTPQETTELFVQLKELKKQGHTIIFISHKLREIKEICDRITILRDGRSVGEADVKELSEQDISNSMVGRNVVLDIQKTEAHPAENILSVRELSAVNKFGKTILNNVSFDVRRGEIFGIAGVEGNGQSELAEILTGLRPYFNGSVKIKGVEIQNLSIRKIRELKTSHVPEDRMTFGIAGDVSIKENLISDRFYKKEYNHSGLQKAKMINEEADRNIKEYLVKCDGREQPIRMLSGGNIQKVVVAREFSSNPDFILVDQPTRGIDVGATEFVRKQIVKLRDQGSAIVLISADLNEVMELSDSLIVMYEGEIVAYFPDTKNITEKEMGEYMLGIKKMSPEEIGDVIHEK
ncbi:ABC transporter ATP-binding protein [Caproiciproducens galactitolivorans]|uniref:Galactose/methyl galactoside import ATP-binding protein MglA n=1 Tax=Caproiciproducens galactitolivorans TaxID=642589 RepID=A0A4Z0Y326_9FIRM|nr:ABC transporter ATP-binding protein [Caproiciproducens galactitolivorans]QEY35551.1 ABC transporter ATP-binding protein [Caproiciproducens galactitolivorans]TGJ77277.1 galactose/methyl galactoside import ATP-binding protein MglA [Caproiciproducens galactitolivorans]